MVCAAEAEVRDCRALLREADDRGHWLIVGTFRNDERVRAEPFDAIELDLAILWADVQL